MRRAFNLQRDPDSGELFAIGKSDRPYAFDEVRALEQAAEAGDARAILRRRSTLRILRRRVSRLG